MRLSCSGWGVIMNSYESKCVESSCNCWAKASINIVKIHCMVVGLQLIGGLVMILGGAFRL